MYYVYYVYYMYYVYYVYYMYYVCECMSICRCIMFVDRGEMVYVLCRCVCKYVHMGMYLERCFKFFY
jgi:hypothetical protein